MVGPSEDFDQRNELNENHQELDERQPVRRRSGKKKKRRSGCSVWALVLLVLFLLVVLVVIFVFRDFSRTSQSIHEPLDLESPRQEKVEVKEGDTPISILLMGIDTGAEGRTETGRSDVMMVMTLNPNSKQMTLVSIPRDTYAYLPVIGQYDKLNHAYAYGGPAASIQAVQGLLDIPVDYYVSVDMQGLTELIDAIGGITITPTITISQSGYNFQEGVPVTVDGQGALAYVRNRYDDPQGDYGRQARQRQVIFAAVDEVLSLSGVVNYRGILSSVSNSVRTNMTPAEMRQVGTNYASAAQNREEVQLSGNGQMQNGVYYDFIPEDQLSQVSNRLQDELELSE